MKDRIRVNGVLYEAVSSMNESVNHTSKGAIYYDMRPEDYRRYRWARPFSYSEGSIAKYSHKSYKPDIFPDDEDIEWTMDIIFCKTDEFDYAVVAAIDIINTNDPIPRNSFGIKKPGYYELILEDEGYDSFERLINTLDNNYFDLKYLFNSLKRRGFVLRKKRTH